MQNPLNDPRRRPPLGIGLGIGGTVLMVVYVVCLVAVVIGLAHWLRTADVASEVGSAAADVVNAYEKERGSNDG